MLWLWSDGEFILNSESKWPTDRDRKTRVKLTLSLHFFFLWFPGNLFKHQMRNEKEDWGASCTWFVMIISWEEERMNLFLYNPLVKEGMAFPLLGSALTLLFRLSACNSSWTNNEKYFICMYLRILYEEWRMNRDESNHKRERRRRRRFPFLCRLMIRDLTWTMNYDVNSSIEYLAFSMIHPHNPHGLILFCMEKKTVAEIQNTRFEIHFIFNTAIDSKDCLSSLTFLSLSLCLGFGWGIWSLPFTSKFNAHHEIHCKFLSHFIISQPASCLDFSFFVPTLSCIKLAFPYPFFYKSLFHM